ncbi:hypothetical protein Raf01_70270 [Rugosimonospora africana]|uniref:DUF58 domain-containing protein n=1 Tax=Rugosimonospora africana TaxID=556532 RepID=A0A8J3QWT5_9ACTN|nr:hypothetical protein Raf01_70270 [Rugosimonospora africana]
MAAGTVLCFVGAWFLGYAELAVLGTGCLAALVLGRLVLLRRTPLRVHREVAPTRVTRGEEALGVVTVGNLGRRVTRPLVATDRCGDSDVSVEIPRLRPGTSNTTTYFLPTSRRGEIPVGPLRLSATDPLGLFRRVHAYGDPATLLVHPRTVAIGALPSGRAANVDGPTSDTAPSGTVTFHALREYVFGDDLRHIHWRTSARTGRLMVRHLVDSSLPRTIVLLDNREASYVDSEGFEVAVDVAASILLAAARSGFPIAVLTADGPYFTAEGGRAETGTLLRQLALVRAAGPADLAAVIGAVRPGQSGGSLSMVTGTAGAEEIDRLSGVRAHFDRTVLVRTGTGLPPLPAGLPVTAIDAADLTAFAAGWRATAGAGVAG